MQRYLMYVVIFAVGFFGWIESAFAGRQITLTVLDSAETPYQWNEADCQTGGGDLTVLISNADEKTGSLRFRLRGIAERLGDLAPGQRLSLELPGDGELALSFRDRQSETWIFQPHRRRSQCAFILERRNEGELEISGTCRKLVGLKPPLSFATGFEISADEPIVCPAI